MKTIDLEQERFNLESVINLARQEPVLLLTSDGREFLLTEADDFETEVQALRDSRTFQRWLDERSQSARRVSLEEIEAEIEQELTGHQQTV
jgi:hypothetical protein